MVAMLRGRAMLQNVGSGPKQFSRSNLGLGGMFSGIVCCYLLSEEKHDIVQS